MEDRPEAEAAAEGAANGEAHADGVADGEARADGGADGEPTTESAAGGEPGTDSAAGGEAPSEGSEAAAGGEERAGGGARREPRSDSGPRRDARGDSGGGDSRADRTVPLRKLVELAAKYAEVGPPLADLCFAIGESEVAEQLVRLGTQGGGGAGSVEYWFVAANAARRQRRYDDALRATVEAVQAFAASPGVALGDEGESRFLHLVRLGFATLMFDVRDLSSDTEFARALGQNLPVLQERLGSSSFYRTLLAQTLWFTDKEASEREWDKADELGDHETTWNARGTWYNEAEHDLEKAERAYRRGLEKVPASALLMHNLAQILLEKARRPGVSADEVRRRLNQATELLRAALRQDAPRLRRHIHATRDRVEDLRRTLPPLPPRGDRDRGPRDNRYDNRYARDRGGPPPDRAAAGGDRGHDRAAGGDRAPAGDRSHDRAPGGGGGGDRDRGPRRPRESQPSQPKQKFLVDGTVSLGEMILAKLKEKEQEKG